MKRSPDYIARKIAGESLLVPVGAAAQKFNGMITLNEVADFIWSSLDGVRTEEDIVKLVLDEFEVDEETARRDVYGFTGALKQQGLIIE